MTKLIKGDTGKILMRADFPNSNCGCCGEHTDCPHCGSDTLTATYFDTVSGGSNAWHGKTCIMKRISTLTAEAITLFPNELWTGENVLSDPRQGFPVDDFNWQYQGYFWDEDIYSVGNEGDYRHFYTFLILTIGCSGDLFGPESDECIFNGGGGGGGSIAITNQSSTAIGDPTTWWPNDVPVYDSENEDHGEIAWSNDWESDFLAHGDVIFDFRSGFNAGNGAWDGTIWSESGPPCVLGSSNNCPTDDFVQGDIEVRVV